MQIRYEKYLNMLRGVQRFLDVYGAGLGGINSTSLRRSLDTLTDEILTLAASQASAALRLRARYQREQAMAEALRRQYLRPIAGIIKSHLPSGKARNGMHVPYGAASTTTVVTSARAFAEIVSANPEVFEDFDEDLGQRLGNAVDDVERFVTDKRQQRATRSHATAGIREAVSRARRVVAALDAIVKARLHGNEKLLVRWRHVVTTR
jgi:multidrug efflux pump subunit AcrA (membrane-fusion protein)